MQRVMIIGQPGSGKSTLARQLGDLTGLPVVHVDRIHWQPGWVERPKPEKIALARAAEAQDTWVFEGGLSATWDTRFARADTVIFLDLPLWLRAWRVVKRRLRYRGGATRPDLPENCPERFNWEFTKWIWDTRQTGKTKGRALMAKPVPGKRLYHLTSPRMVRNFLRVLETDLKTGQKRGHGKTHNRASRP